jgi:hypothetical protein
LYHYLIEEGEDRYLKGVILQNYQLQELYQTALLGCRGKEEDVFEARLRIYDTNN